MEDLIVGVNQMSRIKNHIDNLKGKPVIIKTKSYRGKAKIYEGIISGVYSTYFNVQLEKPISRQIGFLFSDILTKEITIKEI